MRGVGYVNPACGIDLAQPEKREPQMSTLLHTMENSFNTANLASFDYLLIFHIDISGAYRLCGRESGVYLVEDDGEAVHVRPLQDGHGRQRAARSRCTNVELLRLRSCYDFFGVDRLEESGGFAEAQQFRRPERSSEVCIEMRINEMAIHKRCLQ